MPAAGVTPRRRTPAALGALAAVAFLAAGCGSPVGIRTWSLKDAYRQSYASALTSEHPTAYSTQALLRLGLYDTWQENPSEALAALHDRLDGPGQDYNLFALAELSFLEARHRKDSGRFLAAAVYAWAFLVHEDGFSQPIPLDPRNRIAADIYNAAVAKGFALPHPITNESGEPAGDQEDRVAFRAGTRPLPFGELEVEAPERFTWGDRTVEEFIPAVQYDVRGLRNRYRNPGIGAPLIATLKANEASGKVSADDLMAESSKMAVTAILRLDQARSGLAKGRLRGSIELHPWGTGADVEIAGVTIPLEFETTATLAYSLKDAPVFEWEVKGFFGLRQQAFRNQAGNLATVGPYRPGTIPVVFVHGTASSPFRWAELLNELMADERIARRYQFWFFTYNTGDPIPLTAGVLRKSLTDAVAGFDPEGKDPALRKMVVIGHSQGGLLTKTTVIDSGDLFWRNIDDKPLAQLDLTPETRQLLERSLFYTPLPFVDRVIFMSTPHRGSFVAGGWLGRWIGKLVRAPATVLSAVGELAHAGGVDAETRRKLTEKRLGSVDNMDPSNSFIKTLASIPVDPRVKAYSIIAVKGDGPLEEETDGVVAYPSAHIDEAVSEKVVRSGHSVQSQPEAIEEVRRILLEAPDPG